MAHAIGFGPCLNCEATVEYRINSANRAFYRCNGSADAQQKACGLEVKAFGAYSTKLLVEKFKKEIPHVVENRTDDAKPEPVGKPKPVSKRESSGHPLYGD